VQIGPLLAAASSPASVSDAVEITRRRDPTSSRKSAESPETMARQATTNEEVCAMHGTSRSTSATLILTLALALMACAEGAADEPRHKAAGVGIGMAPCPTPAEIETAIGFPVKSRLMVADRCMYELTGQYQGAFVTLSYQPATRATDVFAEVRQRVKGARGANAQPDRLSVGEGGLAYSSRGKKEAATVSQGRLYHVEMDYDLFEGLKLQEDAAVRVIELAMRTAPAGDRAASFDACQLATNAEVSGIAEERPDLAKYWSAPTASLGGSHCDYDGGSIRVYQGKASAAALDGTLKAYKADREPRTPVGGIGDKAFFMIPMPDNKYNRLGLLAVYAGPRVLQLTLDAQGDEPIEATRPRLERLARLVLPRLR